jgi:hypothetical protein
MDGIAIGGACHGDLLTLAVARPLAQARDPLPVQQIDAISVPDIIFHYEIRYHIFDMVIL